MKPTAGDITFTLQGQDPGIIEIERGLIGGCLVDTRGTKAWPMTLRPHEFYLDRHRIIWQAMLDLSEETGQPDLVLLIDTLRRAGNLDAVGRGAALAEMVEAGSGAFDLAHYAALIREAATSRARVAFGAKLASNPNMSSEQVEKALRALDSAVGAATASPLEDFRAERKRIENSPALKTGLYKLDGMTRGISTGQVITIGGRTSHGKTTFSTFLGKQFAKLGISVDYLSLEERRPDIVNKWIAQETGIPIWKLMRETKLDYEDEVLAERAAMKLDALPLRAYTIRSHHETDIIAAVAASKAAVVFIDHVQQIITPADEPRAYALERIMNRLVAIAISDNKVIFAAAQINRAIDSRKSAPELNDLRDSGALEHVPRQVWFVYWPAKYHADRHPYEFELHIAKAAVGPIGPVPMTWEPQCGRFSAGEDSDTRSYDSEPVGVADRPEPEPTQGDTSDELPF
jgi:replicative DNA helicase